MMVRKEMVMMDLVAMVILMVMKVMTKVIAGCFVCMRDDSNGSHAAQRNAIYEYGDDDDGVNKFKCVR